MPTAPITMPQLGESIAEATVLRFLVESGAEVVAGQELIEVETSKATMTVTSPARGRLIGFTAAPGQSFPVGSQLGTLEVAEDFVAPLGSRPASPLPHADAHDLARTQVEPTVRGLPVPAHAGGASYLSPRMRARMEELGLHAADMAGIAGSGANGRVTIEDFEAFIRNIGQFRTSPASSMRVAVADAMRRSWTRPLATVGLPFRIDPLLKHRQGRQPKPGPALYALRALALALAENSGVAGRLVGHTLVHPGAIDIGFAVEAEDGVLVPVLRGVDKRSLAECVVPYQTLLEQARERRLPAECTGGSIATITNFGTFGLTWATPIPLPEQTLVLGLGAGRKVPSWCEQTQAFVPITEAELTLSFDHRVLDGGAAGRLLGRVAEWLGKPEEL